MNDCFRCPVVEKCHYPFKVCDCDGQEKFWDAQDRAAYEIEHDRKMANLTGTAKTSSGPIP